MRDATTTTTQAAAPLTEERKAELAQMLRDMQELSNAFYARAARIGCHPFIEFTGFMNEWLKICAKNLAAGVDFEKTSIHSGKPLVIAPYEASYLGEKFGCIFGSSLHATPALAEEFWASVGGAPVPGPR
jgi:hypothetical protein